MRVVQDREQPRAEPRRILQAVLAAAAPVRGSPGPSRRRRRRCAARRWRSAAGAGSARSRGSRSRARGQRPAARASRGRCWRSLPGALGSAGGSARGDGKLGWRMASWSGSRVLAGPAAPRRPPPRQYSRSTGPARLLAAHAGAGAQRRARAQICHTGAASGTESQMTCWLQEGVRLTSSTHRACLRGWRRRGPIEEEVDHKQEECARWTSPGRSKTKHASRRRCGLRSCARRR